MMFFYYPLILISILGYGLFTSKKLIKLKTNNLGYLGIVGIFFLILISYISTQFIAHDQVFNSLILLIGLGLFIFYFNQLNPDKKNIKLLITIFILSLIFILVGKNHDDFHYYHFSYIVTLTEYPHPVGFGKLNHGFKTHSSIFLLSSLFSLPAAKYNLFHLVPAYILVFSNFILIKLIFNKDICKNYIFITFLSLSSLVFINSFFYRLGEHGTDRSAMILIILLLVNYIYFINKKLEKINSDYLKIFTIIFTIIISLKALYIIYIILFFPLIIYVYQRTKSVNLFINKNLFFCFLLFGLVILTNFLNTGCLLFPEKKTCFFNTPWSLSLNAVEYLGIHYENWAKAGSGAGYALKDVDKLNYISDFNWVQNWINKYFFNKVSDFLLSLALIFLVFVTLFKSSKSLKNYKRNYKFLFILLLVIFAIWFSLHPLLRYGGYHLFFLIAFIPTSIILEKFSKNIKNLDRKILTIVMITVIVFIGRNANRLVKEYKIYSYNPLVNINYPLKKDSFSMQKRIKKMIDEKKAKEIYENRYIVF